MAVSLSIKNVPVKTVQLLRQRAKRHHRSLQGELLDILEQALQLKTYRTLEELDQAVRDSGLRTPDEATRWIREARDSR